MVRIVTAVLQGTSVRGVFQIVTCCVDPERVQGGVASFKNNVAEKWRLLTSVVQAAPEVVQ